MRRTAVGLLAVILSSSCVTPPGTSPRFSDTSISAPTSAPAGVDVVVDFAGDGYLVEVENETSASILFRWDLASFVSTDGVSGFLLPGTTRMLEINQQPRSEPVPPGARLSRVAVPVWEGDVTDPAGISFDAPCSAIVGRPIRLVLPIEVAGDVHEYTATFEVEGVLMVRHVRGQVVKKECTP